MTTIASLLTLASSSLINLANEVKADSRIDSDEVTQLKNEIYADGTVGAEEVAVLFDLADNCSFDTDFEDLVSRAVRDYAYADGTIDAEEAKNITNFIEADGTYSDLEVRILNEILTSGASMPEDFHSWATGIINS